MAVTPELEKIQFPEHYAYALVGSKEKREVYFLPITGGYVGFIERIACDWFEGSDPPNTRSIIEFVVDGFTRKYEYEIQINKPYIFDPPLVARSYIRWYVTNNDVPHTESGVEKTGAHYYGILCDGFLAKPKSF